MAKRDGEEKTRGNSGGFLRRAFTVASWGVLGGAAGQILELAFPGWLPTHWFAAAVGGLSGALAGVGIFRAYRRSPGAVLASQLREANRLFKDGQLSKREFEQLRGSIIRQYNP